MKCKFSFRPQAWAIAIWRPDALEGLERDSAGVQVLDGSGASRVLAAININLLMD